MIVEAPPIVEALGIHKHFGALHVLKGVDLKVAERPDTFALPRTAILMKEQQASCLTVNAESAIVRTPITIGIRAGEEIEIVSGLTGEERIIAGNVAAYREGQTVEVVTGPPK